MKDFWNERYAEPQFVYGTEPNIFLRQELARLAPGSLLLPAEGEGRNAVYAATAGWRVSAYDYSEAGRQKAMDLAKQRGVSIDYRLSTHEEVAYAAGSFDVVALIYAHTPAWRTVYPALTRFLRPGGTLIIELFNKNQLQNSSGGPKSIDQLVNADELEEVLAGFDRIRAWDERLELDEGPYHAGKADVVRCIATKAMKPEK